MNEVVEKALVLWGMAGAEYQLFAARENAIYQVKIDKYTVALRLHRQGYRSDEELRSELKWMAAIAEGGITVPAPILSASNELIHCVDGVQVDILTWLSGSPLSGVFASFNGCARSEVFFNIGRTMAMLHDISDAWTQPTDFIRCAWNRKGLLGETPLWDRFWDNPTLSAEDRQLFLHLRKTATLELISKEYNLDYGLIHADMVSENLMLDGESLHLIDFDDGGFGFRIFEIATALLKNIDENDYPKLKAALIDGYSSIRIIDLSMFNLFLALRAASYVGWNITRMDEKGASGRNARFVNTARRMAQVYLAD